VHDVQLGVGSLGQLHGPQSGQLGLFGAVGSQQDLVGKMLIAALSSPVGAPLRYLC
jgi:hypothetical protein